MWIPHSHSEMYAEMHGEKKHFLIMLFKKKLLVAFSDKDAHVISVSFFSVVLCTKFVPFI